MQVCWCEHRYSSDLKYARVQSHNPLQLLEDAGPARNAHSTLSALYHADVVGNHDVDYQI